MIGPLGQLKITLKLKWYSDEGESGAKYRPGFDEIVYGEVSNPPL